MEKIYTKQEVAELLSIPVSTVSTLIRRGEIKAIKVGRQYRVRESSLKDYIDFLDVC